MESELINPPQTLRSKSRLEKLIPFETAFIRYLLLAWLLVGVCAAVYAFAYSKPKIKEAYLQSAYLFDLEQQYQDSAIIAAGYNLEELRAQSQGARRFIFEDRESANKRISDLTSTIRERGWRAVLVATQTNEELSPHLDYVTYQLELTKVGAPSAGSNSGEGDSSHGLLPFLKEIRSGEKKLDVDNFQALSENHRLSKVAISLSATIAK